MGTLTSENFTEELKVSWGKVTRGDLAEECIWHTYDHYGQAVIYARMNGIITPASRK